MGPLATGASVRSAWDCFATSLLVLASLSLACCGRIHFDPVVDGDGSPGPPSSDAWNDDASLDNDDAGKSASVACLVPLVRTDSRFDRSRVALANSGNLYVVGKFGTQLDVESQSVGGASNTMFLASLAPDCTPRWLKGFGGGAFDTATAVAVDSNENVYIAGAFSGIRDFGDGPVYAGTAGTNAVIASYTSAGVHRWSKQFGEDTALDAIIGVAIDEQDNVYIVGEFGLGITLGTERLVVAGGVDMFLAKFDSAGTHEWSTRHGLTSQERPWGMAVSGGRIAVAGTYRDVGNGFVTANFGGADIMGNRENVFAASYATLDGAHIWSEGFASNDYDRAETVDIDSAGSVLIAGHVGQSVNFGGGSIATGGFLVKLSNLGTHLWSAPLGATSASVGHGARFDMAGNALVTGQLEAGADIGNGSLDPPSVSGGGFLARFDSDGGLIKALGFGGSSGQGLVVEPTGTVVLLGAFDKPLSFDGVLGSGPAGSATDLFVARLSF